MGRMDDDREPPVTSHGGEAPARGRPRRGRRALTALVAFVALGGFAAVVVYSYDKGREAGSGATAPLIQAQEGPTRVRPERPGGMAVPNQDKDVYSRIDPGQAEPRVERLLPPPEAVVDRPPEPVEPEPPPPPEQARPAPGGTAAEVPGPGGAPSPSEARAPTISEAPPPPPPTPERSAAVTDPETPPAAATAFRVQVASLGSEDAAKRAWSQLSAAHKDLFGGLKADIVRAEVSGKGTFYRVQAGPLADASAAKALCDRAKSRNLGCLIVRP